MTPGLYVHIPYCASKCRYCGFHSHTSFDEQGIRLLIEQIGSRLAEHRRSGINRVATLYLGGGTPSLLSPALLAMLVERIRAEVEVVGEATVEANPRSADAGFLRAAADQGFTRLSIGVQSLVKGELAPLGRAPTRLATIERIRRQWQGTLGVDLMIGLPDQQTIAPLLAPILDLGIDSVAVYELTIEPDSPLERDIARGHVQLPDEDTVERLYAEARGLLFEAGLNRYEVSSFARTGAECEHNLAYWRMHPYIGLGPSAVSTLPTAHGAVRERRQTSSLGAPAGSRPRPERETVSPAELLREMVMLALRTQEGLRFESVRALFAAEICDLAPRALAKQQRLGMLRVEPDRLVATDSGLRTLNRVLEAIFVELPDQMRAPRWDRFLCKEANIDTASTPVVVFL